MIQKLFTARVTLILFMVAAIALAIVSFFYFSESSNSKSSLKIGFVQTKNLVYSYTGMKDAQTAFKEKEHQWQENIDTLQNAYQMALGEYNAQAGKLSSDEKQKREMYLRKQEQSLGQYVHSIQERSREEEAKMTQEVLNRINAVIADYAKIHGYEYILGTTDNGNLLYGESKFDLTSDILEELNRKYKQTDTLSEKNSKK